MLLDRIRDMNIISKNDAAALGYSRYFTGKPCLRGHISERQTANSTCIECRNETVRKQRAENPEKYREKGRDGHRANPQKGRERALAYHYANRARILEKLRVNWAKKRTERSEQKRVHRLANKEVVNARNREWWRLNTERINKERNERLKTDPVYAFNVRARNLIRASLASSGFIKPKKTEDILGCSIEEFRRQIERQFLPGMGWHNMHLWHVDHIVPSSMATTQQEAEALNTAGNLRPMWAEDNMSKGDKQTHLI